MVYDPALHTLTICKILLRKRIFIINKAISDKAVFVFNRAKTAIFAGLLQKVTVQAVFSACIALVILCLQSSPVAAQTTTRYTNTLDSAVGGINETATPCSNPLTRTFAVTTSYTVTDINIGILLAHTYRSDLTLRLRAPDNTSVTFMTATGGALDNMNMLLDDSDPDSIGSDASNDVATLTTIVPPYADTRNTANALAALNGKNALGTWTLEICDSATGDAGTFYQADLYLTSPPANFADLSLSKTVASTSSSTAIYTLSVTNASYSTQTATGITVRDILPAGVTFASASGTGTYNSGTGIWTVGSVVPGQTISISITVNITAASGTVITNIAEITASSATDTDSTPNNGITTEDDYAARAFTVGGRLPGLPPSIYGICTSAGVGTTVLDWNTQSWTSGSTTGTASVPALGNVGFALNSQGTFDAPVALNSNNTGGLSVSELSLFESIQYTTASQVTTTTITLPTAVPGLQFTVFDVDYAVNDFADKLSVSGTYNGSPVSATLTNGVANYISGNSAIGDLGSGGTSSDGNVVVTFSSPVDTVVITYGNHTTAPADPDGQAISIHDITFCRPQASLSVTKISSVISDGVSVTNPKAISGATIQYCILTSNSGSGTATDIVNTDVLPADLTFVPGSMKSGTSCGTATIDEDDDNIGADESNPFGMSISGTTVLGSAPSLLPSASFAMVFQVTIN
jgi:uncharacterized repeat protein (TIGR01451 family)